jgi:hypothetical protein
MDADPLGGLLLGQTALLPKAQKASAQAVCNSRWIVRARVGRSQTSERPWL